jgi:hypothetical protein
VKHSIERTIASITEDRRAGYLFDTKVVAHALRCHPNKFHARWYRTRDWLIELFIAQPGETAAEFAALAAQALAERQRRGLDR